MAARRSGGGGDVGAERAEATGWAPTIPFEQTMEDLLNYWRARVAQRENLGAKG